MDVRVYDKQLQAANLAKLLAPAERDVENSNIRPVGVFLNEFKRARKIQA